MSERTETSPFTTALRSELERRVFAGASQVGLDRVFVMEFRGGETVRKLIVEMMPPGNIIVTDQDGEVLAAMHEVRAATRRIVRGGRYSPPAQSRLDPVLVTDEDMRRAMVAEKTLGKAIGRHVSLPRKYVREALRRLGLDEGAASEGMLGREAEVASKVRELATEAMNSDAVFLCDDGGSEEVMTVRPTGLTVRFQGDSLSAVCDMLFLPSVAAEAEAGGSGLVKARAEAKARLAKLASQEAAYLDEARRAREAAMRVSRLDSVGEAIAAARESGVEVPDSAASTAAVASSLFDWAKENERKADSIAVASKRLARQFRGSGTEPRAKRTQLSRSRGEWFERFRWFRTREGRVAVGGRDSQSNSLLVKRHLDKSDTVFHADLHGSPFFVLKGGSAQSEAEAKEVAQATVAFSSAWKTGLVAADAYWVYPSQVSSAAPSGEYLAKGSFAINGRKNFVRKNLVELAIGVDSEGRVVSGPESAIALAADAYVVIRPQREKSSDTAKKVAKDLRPGTSLDDVLRALPPGGGKVLRRVSGRKSPSPDAVQPQP